MRGIALAPIVLIVGLPVGGSDSLRGRIGNEPNPIPELPKPSPLLQVGSSEGESRGVGLRRNGAGVAHVGRGGGRCRRRHRCHSSYFRCSSGPPSESSLATPRQWFGCCSAPASGPGLPRWRDETPGVPGSSASHLKGTTTSWCSVIPSGGLSIAPRRPPVLEWDPGRRYGRKRLG